MIRSIGLAIGALLVTGSLASAQVLYGVTGVDGGSSSLYTVNTTSGATTLVGSTGKNGIGSLSFSPGAVLFGVANGNSRTLVTINLTTGAATSVGSGTGASANITDIAFRSDGTLFAADGHGGFYTINTTTGVATALPSLSSGGPNGGGLAFNSAGTLFLDDGNALYTVNTSTGVTTLSGTLTGLDFATTGKLPGMKFHPTTGVLFGTEFPSSHLVSASSTSGTISVTDIGSTSVALEAIAFPPVGVPVLPFWGLPGLGMLLMALAAWTLSKRRSRIQTV